MNRTARKLLPLVLVLPTACVSPQLQVDTTPAATRLFLDGKNLLKGQGTAKLPLPYYGTMELSARQRLGPTDQPTLQEARKLVNAQAPFSPWLFPLDFLLEFASYPLRGEGGYRHEAALKLSERTPLVQGVAPPDAEALRVRARAARHAR